MSEKILQTDDEVLDYTQVKRKDIVDSITKNGVPSDPKMLSVVLASLDGLDRTALGKKKLQMDANLGTKADVANAAITQLITELRTQSRVTVLVDREPGRLPEDIGPPTLVPGELESEHKHLTLQSLTEGESQ